MFKKRIFLLFLLLPVLAHSQEDLMSILEKQEKKRVDYTIATFKSTRIINGQSVETNHKGVLQFLISHRFGRLNQGAYEFFGLDNATIRLGLEYGITDRLNIGVGRSSFEKTYDGFVKYKLLRQKSGAENFPFTVTGFSSIAIKSLKWPDAERKNYFSSRLFYAFQFLIARKFNDRLSLQVSPTVIHRNLVTTTADQNDVYSIGVGGRYKITESVSVNAEYYWVPDGQIVSKINGENVYESLSIGVDIETGGHVFQLHLTNSRGMIEKFFVGETTGSWRKGDIHFGFNISRVFTIGGGKGWEKKN